MSFPVADPKAFARLCELLGVGESWLRKELDSPDWHESRGGEGEEASVYIGSIFNHSPSGKVYAPWATGNLRPCGGCGGAGMVRNRAANPTKYARAKYLEAQLRKQLKPGTITTLPRWARARIRAAWTTRAANAPHVSCPQCGGIGSREAHLDQRWWEEIEELCQPLGLSFETGEGDGADLFLHLYRDTPPPGDDEDA